MNIINFPPQHYLTDSGCGGFYIVGKKQMLRGGESETRNSSIMKMFNLIGMVKELEAVFRISILCGIMQDMSNHL